MEFQAWILDITPVSTGMGLWVIDEAGRAHFLIDPWKASFFVDASVAEMSTLQSVLASFAHPFHLEPVIKKDFFAGRARMVTCVSMENPLLKKAVVERVQAFGEAALFNADLAPAQEYFFERGLFPLAKAGFDVDESGVCRAVQLADSPWALDYALPPLRLAWLSLEPGPSHSDKNALNPCHARRGAFRLAFGDLDGFSRTHVIETDDGEVVSCLNRRLRDWDPDILLTDGGDSFLLPQLERLAERSGVSLDLSRSLPAAACGKGPLARAAQTPRDRSFFSYGKIVYKPGARRLFGRLHIDRHNSFTYEHTDLDGLFEVARVAQIPLQEAARSTIGTLLSSMQLNWAVQNDVLIPLTKGQSEAFRPAEDLVAADRGGLVYAPEVGWHDDVIEFDFVSMYPEIMIRHNVSPEMINCSCCFENTVPGLRHHICQKRVGMIPQVLRPIVDKRRTYKTLAKEGHPQAASFKKRADAFKWVLVTCFGYLGFRNARFGRIEAHECVNAYSRDILLKAKETAEEAGFHFLHGIVDCLWLQKKGVSKEAVEALRVQIEKATGFPLGFEGRYRWLNFCRSKTNPHMGAPSHYFGVFETGALKVRGLEVRRGDTPPFITELQTRLLQEMAQASCVAGILLRRERFMAIVDDALERLRSGRVEPWSLALYVHLSQGPGDYRHDTLAALAARKLQAAGVSLHAGEALHFLVVSEHDALKEDRVMPLALIEHEFDYDRAYYERLVKRAAAILPFALPGALRSGPAGSKKGRLRAAPEPSDDLFSWAARKSVGASGGGI